MKKIGIWVVFILLASELNSTSQARVNLTCRDSRSQQTYAKRPIITNTTGETIPANKTVYWKADDGDFGSVEGPFAINESKVGSGSIWPGHNYRCEAYYLVPPPHHP